MNILLRVSTTLALTCLVAFSAPKPKTPPKYSLKAKTDRQEALYKIGEDATFIIEAMEMGHRLTTGKVSINLTRDGGETLLRKTIDLEGKPIKIKATLDRPGFIRAQMTMTCEGKKYTALLGAGFEPLKLKATTICPDDFDDFWEAGKARLAQIPLDVKLTPLPKKSSDSVECFAISFANIDNTRIYGFFAKPKRKQGPYPAYVTVPGAGPSPFGPTTTWAGKGALSLVMGVHKYDSGSMDVPAIKAAYKELNSKGTYSHHGKPDREAYYFYRAYLGINRAIEWLAAREDWDRAHLVVDGSSQGGASALILAGLNHRFTGAAANVPALCEHTAGADKRQPGWPRLVGSTKGKEHDAILQMSAYFDAVNFARRIQCPVIVSAGFIDRTCPPGTVYAAYNEIKTRKKMFNGPLNGHEWSVGDYRSYQPKWIAGRLGLGQPCVPGE